MTYTGNTPDSSGITIGVQDPLTCFHLFIPYSFYDDLLAQTNLYAEQQRAIHNDTSMWNPITLDKLMAFIGLTIAMGIVSLLSLNNYWYTDPILSHSWFRSIMSRDRFRQVLYYVHIVDNTQALPRSDLHYDRLWKVRPLTEVLQSTCGELYNTHPQVSIDESIIGTKCRLSFIQYLPAKPTKWGIKVWVYSDAVTGYIHSFAVYTGKDPGVPLSSSGLAYDVVMNLLKDKFYKGYSVYIDNFYTSHKLFLDLHAKGVTATATVRTNRKHFPSDLSASGPKPP